MNDKKELQLAKELKRNIQKGFGKQVCKELNFDCPSCKAQALIGHLNWYIDLLEWSIEQGKKPASINTRKSRLKRLNN